VVKKPLSYGKENENVPSIGTIHAIWRKWISIYVHSCWSVWRIKIEDDMLILMLEVLHFIAK